MQQIVGFSLKLVSFKLANCSLSYLLSKSSKSGHPAVLRRHSNNTEVAIENLKTRQDISQLFSRFPLQFRTFPPQIISTPETGLRDRSHLDLRGDLVGLSGPEALLVVGHLRHHQHPPGPLDLHHLRRQEVRVGKAQKEGGAAFLKMNGNGRIWNI